MPNNILITPGSASIQFSGSATNTIRLQVEPSGNVAFYGNSGSLFSITDQLSGSLMSVNDISGLPILEVFSDDRVVMGSYNKNTLIVTGSRVGIDKSAPTADLDVSGSVFITGSLAFSSGGVTGSVFGTSSWANNATSASFATTSSFATTASFAANAGSGLSGGTANYIPLWTSATAQSSSNIYQLTGNIGIGTIVPTARLNVAGNQINTGSFNLSGSISSSGPSNVAALHLSSSNGVTAYFRAGTSADTSAGFVIGTAGNSALYFDFTNVTRWQMGYTTLTGLSNSDPVSLGQDTIPINNIWIRNVLSSGSIRHTGSMFISGTTDTTAANKVLVLNTATNQIFTTASVGAGGGGGLSGGTANYIPLWTSATAQSSSNIYQLTGNIGIGTIAPTTRLNVAGNQINTGSLIISQSLQGTPALQITGSMRAVSGTTTVFNSAEASNFGGLYVQTVDGGFTDAFIEAGAGTVYIGSNTSLVYLGAGGINSGLVSTTAIEPGSNLNFDLGTSANRWRTLFAGSVTASALTGSGVGLTGVTSSLINNYLNTTYIISGGNVTISPTGYGITASAGQGVINNKYISWPTTLYTTAASSSTVFVTEAGVISSSLQLTNTISELRNVLTLSRTYVDVPTYGARNYATIDSRTYNRHNPRATLQLTNIEDYVVTSSTWSGSVATTPTRQAVNFYLANIALLPYVVQYPDIVKRHLDRQIEKFYSLATGTGTTNWTTLHGTTWDLYYHWPYDIINPETSPTASRADSHDSYAATFLLLAYEYATNTPEGSAWWDANWASLYNALYWNLLVREQFMGAGYMTSTFQDVKVYTNYQTVDNLEVLACYKKVIPYAISRNNVPSVSVYANNSSNIINALRAAWSGSDTTGVLRVLYQSGSSTWSANSLNTFYPDIWVHGAATLWDSIEIYAATSASARARETRAMQILTDTAPNWYTSRQYDVFPNGYVVAPLIKYGYLDVGTKWSEFVSTHVAYDSPGYYKIDSVGWVKYVENILGNPDGLLAGKGSNVFKGTQVITGSLIISGTSALQTLVQKVFVTTSAPPTTINYNLLDQSVLFHSASTTANWTLNFRGNSSTTLNSIMNNGSQLTADVLVFNGANRYSASAYQIDGVNITPRWEGGVSGSANTNSLDRHRFTIVKVASASYHLLGSITRYT